MQDYYEVAYVERVKRVVRVVYGTGTADDVAGPDGAPGFTVDAGPSARRFEFIPAGDVNGDGLDDLAASVVGRNGRGYAAVVFGSRSADEVDLAEPGPRGFRITGIHAGTYACGHGDNYSQGPLGVALAAPGDVNRDGRADLLLGVGGADGGCRPGPRGQALLLFGRARSGSVRFSTVTRGALRIVGRGGTGADVGAAGDVNGDRRPDLLVAAPGGAVVVFGRPRGGRIRLAALGAGGFKAWAGALHEGGPLEGAGDLNGDGLGDFVVGSRVVFGKRSSSRVLLDDLGRRGYQVRDRISNAVGFPVGRVAPVGDMNGDRRPDLLAGATELGPPGAWVLFGNGPPLVSVAPLRSAVPVTRPPRLDLPLLCPGNVAWLCRGRVRLFLPNGNAVFAARFRLSAGEFRKRPGRLTTAAVRALRLDGNVRLRAITSATDGRGRRAVTRRELYLVDR
jgi:FG-GAP-like repeat